MRNFLTLWRRERWAFFLSPMAYMIMAFYWLLSGASFWSTVHIHRGTFESPVALLCMAMALWTPALATALSMRLFAEERRQGTLETLMTAPVTEWQVVLGKYAGALTMALAVIAPATASLFILAALAPLLPQPDIGAVVAGTLMLFLLTAFCVAVGMLFSLLTRSQAVAAVCGFTAMVLLLLSSHFLATTAWAPPALVHALAVDDHLLDAARGVVDARPLVLYGSATGTLLFFNARMLALRKS